MASRLPPSRNLVYVATGGAIGAVARVALATWFPAMPGAVPWVTFVENVTGAFLLAILLTLLIERLALDPAVRLLVGMGALGAFTTYSTFAVEVHGLLRVGGTGMAVLYAGGTIVMGLLAALTGVALARAVGRQIRATREPRR